MLFLDFLVARLTLGELRSFAGFFEAVFAALFFARVASQETGFFQGQAKFAVNLEQSARDAMPDSAGLASGAAAFYTGDNIILTNILGNF